MLPQQQQPILDDFIEEAKDHLNTIEQGLLNLHNTLQDPQIINKVFRAVESIKRGAATLEIASIEQTAHHLEDYFQVFKDCPTLQVDQKLESLFLRVFDTLQELFEQLDGLFGLTEDVAHNLMSEVEPVFAALNQHLALLVNQVSFGDTPQEYPEDDDFNDLFALSLDENPKTTPSLSLTEEPDFGALFETLEETEESLEFLEDFNRASLTENPDISAFWGEEARDLEQLDQNIGAVLDLQILDQQASADSSSDLFDTEAFSSSLELDDLDSFAELEVFLGEEVPAITSATPAGAEAALDDFSELDALLDLDAPSVAQDTDAPVEAALDDFSELDALLDLDTPSVAQDTDTRAEAALDDFSELDALLDLDTPSLAPVDGLADVGFSGASPPEDEFGDLDKLLEEANKSPSSSPTVKPTQETATTNRRRPVLEQTMRVPVKNLDNLNNVVGELVVNRNSLEQGQERLRQFLDNLQHRVQQLNDLGSRMQELYEQSLMQASLLSSRGGSVSALPSDQGAREERHATGMDFDALEMDRFTGFHTLSQEMIELIVRVRESASDIEFITDETEQVARQFRQSTSQLQEGLTRSRMLPFTQIAERLPRAVRDITLKYGKQAELNIEGGETLIDKVILEQLYDPMTHLVNNSITHGIETPEERAKNNKSPVGKITIRAFHQGNQTVISVADDGAGIDTDRVMTKAIQKGLIAVAQAKTMSRLDVYNLLFHPGFSTKDQVDDFAGRGVGMDVVKTSLSEIRGVINTDSVLGKGTTFTIRLPLTLSIGKALCCLSDKARIAFPMDGVEDMIDVSKNNVQVNAEGQSCITWRDSLLPFRHLKELLNYNSKLSRSNIYGSIRNEDIVSIVVLRSGDKYIALQVDQVLGDQEIVIKQFEGPAPKPYGVAGATVMGDGRIMPIADVLELIDLFHGGLGREGSEKLWEQSSTPVLPETPTPVKTEPTVLIVDDSITVRELLSLTFNKAGYRVQQARDGQEAWEKLRDGLPCDLVFCDIEMPRMDGLELLSRMQKDASLSQLPIAMLTSRGADRHRQMAIQLGASGYFTKPYLEEVLLDGAQRMLKGEVLVTTNSNA